MGLQITHQFRPTPSLITTTTHPRAVALQWPVILATKTRRSVAQKGHASANVSSGSGIWLYSTDGAQNAKRRSGTSVSHSMLLQKRSNVVRRRSSGRPWSGVAQRSASCSEKSTKRSSPAWCKRQDSPMLPRHLVANSPPQRNSSSAHSSLQSQHLSLIKCEPAERWMHAGRSRTLPRLTDPLMSLATLRHYIEPWRADTVNLSEAPCSARARQGSQHTGPARSDRCSESAIRAASVSCTLRFVYLCMWILCQTPPAYVSVTDSVTLYFLENLRALEDSQCAASHNM